MKYEERAQLVALGVAAYWLLDALLDKPNLPDHDRALISTSLGQIQMTTRNLAALIDREHGSTMIGSSSDTARHLR